MARVHLQGRACTTEILVGRNVTQMEVELRSITSGVPFPSCDFVLLSFERQSCHDGALQEHRSDISEDEEVNGALYTTLVVQLHVPVGAKSMSWYP